MSKYYIYGITKDNGDVDDQDEAIDHYFYHKYNERGEYCGRFNALRQYLVDRVKEGSTAYTYPNGRIGACCVVKISKNGVEYLKSIPDGNPMNNISALPEM